MNIPNNPGGVNLNTWISVGGFALTIGAGILAYQDAMTRSEMRHAEAERRIESLEVGRTVNADAIRTMQIANATASAETMALRREITELKADLREVAGLLREVKENGK